MDPGIGPTLRKARNRRKVGLAEVEETTKIRIRYLKAIEDEEWEALPGETYARSFIRTYASYLGLDGDRLVEEYAPRPNVATSAPAPPSRSPRRAPRIPGRAWTVLVVAALVAALVVVGLTSGGEGTSGPSPSPKHPRNPRSAVASPRYMRRSHSGTVALRLAAGAEVWVCVLDAAGRPLIDGQILAAGAQAGPFRSGSFTVAFGNGEVAMTIDGQQASIPPTSSPIGYSIDSEGNLKELSEGERPTCA